MGDAGRITGSVIFDGPELRGGWGIVDDGATISGSKKLVLVIPGGRPTVSSMYGMGGPSSLSLSGSVTMSVSMSVSVKAIGAIVFLSMATPWRVISVGSRGDKGLLDTGIISSLLIMGSGDTRGMLSLCAIFAATVEVTVCRDTSPVIKVGGDILGLDGTVVEISFCSENIPILGLEGR